MKPKPKPVPQESNEAEAGQEKKGQYKIKTNKHLTLSYKNYLQNPHLPP